MTNETVVIREYDNLAAKHPDLASFMDADKGTDFCPATFWAYCNSKGEGKSLLDFHSTIWDKDVKAIVASLRKFGIEEFTISSTACGIVETLALFEAEGAKVQGLTSVKSSAEEIPAILMRVK